jgi:hypothetical protein
MLDGLAVPLLPIYAKKGLAESFNKTLDRRQPHRVSCRIGHLHQRQSTRNRPYWNRWSLCSKVCQ